MIGGSLGGPIPVIPEWQLAVRARCEVAGHQRLAIDDADVDSTIPDRFRRVVTQVPDRPAIVAGEQVLTYAQLHAAVNRTARAVTAGMNGEVTPVAILLDDPFDLAAAQFGVLQAGRAYVVLDRHSPRERLRQILEDADSRLLVTRSALAADVHELAPAACSILYMETTASLSDEPVLTPVSPDSLAALFYTSGTVGRPKGVMRDHRTNLYQVLTHAASGKFHVDDRCAWVSSSGFTASLSELFGTLLTGASLYPCDVRRLTMVEFRDWLAAQRITVCSASVTLFRRLMDAIPGPGYLPELRLVRLASEPTSRSDLTRFQHLFGSSCTLSTRYGQTETASVTEFFSDHTTSIDGDTVPAGYPLPGKMIRLLDEDGEQITKAGAIGQIAVRSRFLSMGYWRQPELTAAKFLPDPEGGDERICLTGDLGRWRADGCLEVVGRADHQVKVRGFRVELAEVEAALLRLADVLEAVVVPSGEGEARRLVAYVVTRGSPAPTVSHLRRMLAAQLPDFMQPARFVFMDTLPVTESGKVARRALPAPPRTRPHLDVAYVAPQTPMETAVARAWATVLDLEEVGIFDRFLDLGGDSLQAGRIVAQLVESFAVELTLQTLLTAPTVSEMALLLVQAQAERMAPSDVARLLDQLSINEL